MTRFVRTTLLLSVLALAGQTLIAPLLTFGGVGPDFALIALVILALSEGAFAGTLGGFVMGLVMDSATPNLLGLNALCKSLTGWGAGRARERLVFGLPLVEGSTVALAALGHDTLFLVVESWTARSPFFRPLFTSVLPSALVTGLVAIPLVRAADLLGLLRRDD